MLGVFSRKSGSLLGIDIGATSVRLLALSRDGRGYRVEAYARQDLAPDSFLESGGVDPEAQAMALSRAWRASGSRLKAAAVAVPGEAVISKLIEMPAELDEAELECQLSLEAGQYIPYPLDEVATDFEVQGRASGNPRRVQVLLVACRHETVEALEVLLARAGLTPQVVESAPLALERCLALLTAQSPVAAQSAVALLDIGSGVSGFSVMRDQRIIYSREQLFGSRQLAQVLEQRFSLTLDQALRVERQGALSPVCIEQALRPFEQDVLQNVQRALQLFAESPQRQPVQLLLLAGEGSRLAGLERRIEQQLGIATALANPFVGMSVGPRVDAQALAEQAPELLLACGLALRGFD
ncbi:pilus assembly protein PilM [Pseudomonas chlororaphis]|uniref:type IV pilus assembly protein PilM n=1 Tax=Pseudomonas chlororaphis TaxID=587753 RepID=UPI00209A6B4C|nr:type IV pilus assembly protein PilM [Pseudomonas chlororaphis]MCO7570255.1 pilus assembly protein PilM [Pseudomonas chlororaphis]MCO7587402.1 pilus assembly protein PilM [Pseudomonas chlororaphis]